MKILRGILMIINIVAALGLVASTFACDVSPDSNLLPSIAAYAYLPMLAVNVLMVLVWALMGKWQLIISVVAIAVRWSMVGMYVQVGGTRSVPSREEHPQMVSLLTYNVHQFMGPGQETTATDDNARRFLQLVDEHKPDVMCLQEFAAVKGMQLVDSLMLRGYNHYHGSKMTRAGVPYGTVVFSQMPITYVTDIDKEKVMVEIMHHTGQRFRVCSIHMDSYRFDDADREEIERMRHGDVDSTSRRTLSKVKQTILNHQQEWEKRVKPIATESTLPIIVAGDMNDIPSSWLYQQLSKHLRDCFRDCGSGLSITYHGGFPQFRIDMVFHSDDIGTLSYRRIRTDISDHYPVMTAMEIVK